MTYFRVAELGRAFTRLNGNGITLVSLERGGDNLEKLLLTTDTGVIITLYADGANYKAPSVLTPNTAALP